VVTKSILVSAAGSPTTVTAAGATVVPATNSPAAGAPSRLGRTPNGLVADLLVTGTSTETCGD